MMDLLYELIRISAGTQDSLSRIPSEEEWDTLYHLANKQSVLGVCFVGLQKLGANADDGFTLIGMSEAQYLTWMAVAAQIQERNEKINRRCIRVQNTFSADGLETCILKGQGVASFYHEDLKLFRQSGDIDVWVNGTWKTVMDYVNARTPNREFDRKHTHISLFKGTIVEVHWWPSMPANPLYEKRLQSFYTKQAPVQCKHTVQLPKGAGVITAPDAVFDSIHIMYHVFNHFLYEGIGLRQMMDLYFVLTNGGITEQQRVEISGLIKEVGLGRFAPAAIWVLEKVFGMKPEYAVCGTDEKLGKVLLAEIEEGGNFGHFSQENKVVNESFSQRMRRRFKRRIRLVKYNPVGLVCSPFRKLRIILWKQIVIRKYNL